MIADRPTTPRAPLIKGSLVHIALAHHYGLQAIAQGGLTWEEKYDPAALPDVPADQSGAQRSFGLPPKPPQTLLDAGPSTRGWHFYEAFLRCPQFWAYRYLVDKANPKPALAVRRMKLTDPYDLFTPENAVRELAFRQGEAQASWTEHFGLVLAAYQVHARAYGEEDKAWRIVAVEQEMRTEIDGIPYTQRADLIYEHHGRVYIVDHKTASQVSTKTATRYTLSGQFLGLRMFGHRLFGDQFGGVIINFVGTTLPTKLMRVRPEAAPWALTRFMDGIRWANEQLAALGGEAAMRGEASRDPWHYPKVLSEQVCVGPYGLCDFYDRCRWGKSEGGHFREPV